MYILAALAQVCDMDKSPYDLLLNLVVVFLTHMENRRRRANSHTKYIVPGKLSVSSDLIKKHAHVNRPTYVT